MRKPGGPEKHPCVAPFIRTALVPPPEHHCQASNGYLRRVKMRMTVPSVSSRCRKACSSSCPATTACAATVSTKSKGKSRLTKEQVGRACQSRAPYAALCPDSTWKRRTTFPCGPKRGDSTRTRTRSTTTKQREQNSDARLERPRAHGHGPWAPCLTRSLLFFFPFPTSPMALDGLVLSCLVY